VRVNGGFSRQKKKIATSVREKKEKNLKKNPARPKIPKKFCSRGKKTGEEVGDGFQKSKIVVEKLVWRHHKIRKRKFVVAAFGRPGKPVVTGTRALLIRARAEENFCRWRKNTRGAKSLYRRPTEFCRRPFPSSKSLREKVSLALRIHRRFYGILSTATATCNYI